MTAWIDTDIKPRKKRPPVKNYIRSRTSGGVDFSVQASLAHELVVVNSDAVILVIFVNIMLKGLSKRKAASFCELR